MLDRLKNLPGLHGLRRWKYERHFAASEASGRCRGVYDSFAAALASAPRMRATGYDHPAGAALYRERMTRVYAMDYPVLYWLRALFPEGVRSLFDFGGHVGLCYYAWQRHLVRHPSLRWTVCDLPAVVAEGEALARERGEKALAFTTELAGASGAEVLLANGALQYLEQPFAGLLRELPRLPRVVIVNKLPTHASRRFVTLQNIGVSYCAYQVHDAEEIPRSLAALGYVERDRWENAELRCEIPFADDATPVTYRGYCLEQR